MPEYNGKAVGSTNDKMNTNKNGKKKKASSSQKTLWLIIKMLAIPIIAFLMFMIGMATGYKYGGGAPGEVFETSTWRNIFMLIFG